MKKILFRLSTWPHNTEHAEQLMNQLSIPFLTPKKNMGAILDIRELEDCPRIDELEDHDLLGMYVRQILRNSFVMIVMPWNLPSDEQLIKTFGDKYLGFYIDQPKPLVVEYLKSIERIDGCPDVLDDINRDYDDIGFSLLELSEAEEDRLRQLYVDDKAALTTEMAEMLQRSIDYRANNRPNIIKRGFNSAD